MFIQSKNLRFSEIAVIMRSSTPDENHLRMEVNSAQLDTCTPNNLGIVNNKKKISLIYCTDIAGTVGIASSFPSAMSRLQCRFSRLPRFSQWIVVQKEKQVNVF